MKSWLQSLFPSRIDHKKVVAAIAAAEVKTSGEIRVVIVRHRVANAVAEAEREFARLGMERTHQRNGVLILLAPRSRTFAVIGDTGIHQKCGDGFWSELVEAMSALFRSGHFTSGLEHGITRAGELLAAHFPPESGDGNELSNDIVERP